MLLLKELKSHSLVLAGRPGWTCAAPARREAPERPHRPQTQRNPPGSSLTSCSIKVRLLSKLCTDVLSTPRLDTVVVDFLFCQFLYHCILIYIVQTLQMKNTASIRWHRDFVTDTDSICGAILFLEALAVANSL